MSSTDKRRRWLGATFLLAALGMLVAGETLLRSRLGGVAFVIYWLACFVFTGLALLFASLDAAIVRRRARAEQREFLEDTLKEIERERAARQQNPPKPSDPAP
jgi:membrane protein implicated in regulation of membrane protease activity